MSAERDEALIRQEPLPLDQVTALRGYADDLFQHAAHPFSGVSGAGSAEREPKRRARYRSLESGTLWTILEPGHTPAPASWVLTLEVETPAPPSLRWPNLYLQERFVVVNYMGVDDCEYFLGTNTYTPEGQYIPTYQNLDDIREAHPELGDFDHICAPEHFLDRLLSISQLGAADEIGCEPNPYATI